MKKINQIEPSIGKEETKEILSVVRSGWYSEGKKTREFEKMFSKFVGCKYASAVTSGTTALYIGLKALGIGKGDEVIVPDFTFIASANAIEMTGAKPVLIDIEPQTLNLDQTKLADCITKKTKAIMPVDLNGRSTNMHELKEFARKNNLFLIEDAAQAIGSYHKGKHMGNFGDVGAFSFSTPKIITTGQGGMIITNKKDIYEKCLALKDFGRTYGTKSQMRKIFDHRIIGYNFKFTAFQAAVGIAQMRKLKTHIKKKRKIFKKYRDSLTKIKKIKFVNTNLNRETVWSADIILRSNLERNKLIDHLEKRKIETRMFFPAIHTLLPYKESNSKFKVSTEISGRGLYLPSSVTLTEKQLDFISNKIIEFFI